MSTAIYFPGMNPEKKDYRIKNIGPMNSVNLLLTNNDLLKYKEEEEVPIKRKSNREKSSKRKSSRGKTVKKRKRAVKSHDRRPVNKLATGQFPRRKTRRGRK